MAHKKKDNLGLYTSDLYEMHKWKHPLLPFILHRYSKANDNPYGNWHDSLELIFVIDGEGEARMESEGEGKWNFIAVLDADARDERRTIKYVFRGQIEAEGIRGASDGRSVTRRQRYAVHRLLGDRKESVGRKAVRSHFVGLTVDVGRLIPEPTADRKQDWRNSVPEWIVLAFQAVDSVFLVVQSAKLRTV